MSLIEGQIFYIHKLIKVVNIGENNKFIFIAF